MKYWEQDQKLLPTPFPTPTWLSPTIGWQSVPASSCKEVK